MDVDLLTSIVWAAVFTAAVASIYFARRRRQRRTKHLMVTELLKGYFRGDMAPDRLGQRTREITDYHFLRSAEFHSLAVRAFQRAIDASFAHQPYSKEDERRLLGLFAALKNEFGLTDLFQIESWRAGRE